MLRCQAAATASRSSLAKACNWCVAIEVLAMHGCLCLEAASAQVLSVRMCVLACLVLKLYASRSNNANEIYRQNLAQRLQATSIATLRIRTVAVQTNTTYTQNNMYIPKLDLQQAGNRATA